MVTALSSTPHGKQAFIDRPLLEQVNLQHLHQLPTETLGYLYADQMIRNKLTPLSVDAEVNDAVTYLQTHISETHDIWHVVTGADTDKSGEVQLEAFYVAQLYPDRLFLALITKNLLKTILYEIEFCEQIMDALTQGWMMGRQAKPLFDIQWN